MVVDPSLMTTATWLEPTLKEQVVGWVDTTLTLKVGRWPAVNDGCGRKTLRTMLALAQKAGLNVKCPDVRAPEDVPGRCVAFEASGLDFATAPLPGPLCADAEPVLPCFPDVLVDAPAVPLFAPGLG